MNERMMMSAPALAERWDTSTGRLANLRWAGEGPAYVKIGGRVLYRLSDVVAYEDARRVEPIEAA